MHLIVNAQPLQSPGARHRGIGRYGRHLLQELARARPAWRIEAVANVLLPDPDPLEAGPHLTIRPFQPPLPLRAESREANERYFGDWLTALTPDVVLELSFFEEIGLVPRFGDTRPLLAGVAYDLIPLIFHEQYLSDPVAEAFYGERLRRLAAADLLLAISEATRDDVHRLLDCPPDRVVAILGAAEFAPGRPAATNEDAGSTRSRFDIDRPFLLYVGGTDHRKNLRGTLAAYAELPAAVRHTHLLVIVCALTAGQEASLREDAARLGIEGDLRLTNFVDDAVLQTLYRTCRLSIFPSFYEGLGLPVLEALSCGAPVVASDCAAIREFAGPVSELADPSSPAAIAAAIQKTLGQPRETGEDSRQRFAAGFRWADTAERAASALERATRREGPLQDARLRLAWVSPLPPTESRVAGRSAALLDRMPSGFDIEVVISGDAAVSFEIARRFRVLRDDEVDARHEAAPFDLFVFHAGDGERHLYILDLLRRHSGLTVLHEIRLGRLALAAAAVGGWPDLDGELDAEGAAEAAAAVRRGAADERSLGDACLLRPFLRSSDAAAVWNAADWVQVRARTPVPVFSLDGGRDLDGASSRLAAAIQLTQAARARGDRNWTDAAASALADASRGQVVPDALIDEWVRLRAASRARVTAAR